MLLDRSRAVVFAKGKVGRHDLAQVELSKGGDRGRSVVAGNVDRDVVVLVKVDAAVVAREEFASYHKQMRKRSTSF